jgi:hypothetical protein
LNILLVQIFWFSLLPIFFFCAACCVGIHTPLWHWRVALACFLLGCLLLLLLLLSLSLSFGCVCLIECYCQDFFSVGQRFNQRSPFLRMSWFTTAAPLVFGILENTTQHNTQLTCWCLVQTLIGSLVCVADPPAATYTRSTRSW